MVESMLTCPKLACFKCRSEDEIVLVVRDSVDAGGAFTNGCVDCGLIILSEGTIGAKAGSSVCCGCNENLDRFGGCISLRKIDNQMNVFADLFC